MQYEGLKGVLIGAIIGALAWAAMGALSCAAVPENATPTMENWRMLPNGGAEIVVHIDTAENIAKRAAELNLPPSTRGFSELYGGLQPRCVIHVPPMTDGMHAIQVWMHEIRHCQEGAWHE